MELHNTIIKFSEIYPNIDIEIQTGNHEELYELIKSDKLDLIINDQRRALSEEYINHFLYKSTWYIEIYAVGNIDKGNTEVIAEYIRDITGADLFKVEPAKSYSKNYKECCDEALEEKRENARPELKEYLEDISEYEVIYIGLLYTGELCQWVCLQSLKN